MTHIYILALGIGLALFSQLLNEAYLGALRRKALYPKAGAESMADVYRLSERKATK
jgi:hypothetical protein